MKLESNILLFYQWFTNPNKERIVSKKIYLNYLFLISAITFFSLIFINYFLNLYELSVIAIVVFFIVILLWYANRVLKSNLIPMIGGLVLLFVLTNLFYIKNNGLYGPVSYFVFPNIFVILYFGNKKSNIILFTIIFLNIITFGFLDYKHIVKSIPYEDRLSQFLDIYTTLILTATILTLFLTDIIKIHLKEKKIATESNKLKTAFLANTSHDIRTPVNSINGFCTLLKDGEFTKDELPGVINIIHSNSKQLLCLISDIFDISIIESGNFVLHPTTFNLNTLIANIENTFSQIIKTSEKNILLQAHYGLQSRESTTYADSVRITQILTNLIQNAVNHTKSGTINFGYEKELNNDYLLFYVKDTGTGIPRNMLEGIFERNITDVSHSNRKGTGLGLHISRSLVKLMKGKIWVYSEENVGSHFFFRVPIQERKDI